MRAERAVRACLAGALLMLAGCAAPPVGPADRPAFGTATAQFRVARDDQVIEVRALDRLAISEAALVMPDGKRVPAYSIDTVPNPAGAAASSPMPATVTLVGQIASSALIRVPYPADYAAEWRKARIEIRLGEGRDAILRVLKAPPPD